ncbi:unnamed protein product [Thelazia callipaeda]|uniref:LisH domain-containing protein n=1 Tax=Thelazia callipaeda TaxID=103827 RepID=A0A0N5CWE5_THECL|nr:unnamed protein product [Thelazia callipaeda]
MSNTSNLKQAILEKLRSNGTLDRIQAELRYAIFLAIENAEENKSEGNVNLEQKPEYSIIYHFLRQNRFLATAAVFEKEMQQEIISLEKLREEKDASAYCLKISDDDITLSILNTQNKNNVVDYQDARHDCMNRNNWKIEKPDFDQFNSDVRANSLAHENRAGLVGKQKSPVNNESNDTLKNSDLSAASNVSTKTLTDSIVHNMEKKNNDNEFETNLSLFKLMTAGGRRKYNKESSISSTSIASSISSQKKETSVPKVPLLKSPTLPSHPRKLPPIDITRSETALPSRTTLKISQLKQKESLSSQFDALLDSPSSTKHSINEDMI